MRRWFYLVVALQLVFLGGEAGRYYYILQRGATLFLRVMPVDPRSLFMGNYMALSYDISSIDLRKFPYVSQLPELQAGATVYVVLVPQQPWARMVNVSPYPPWPESGQLILRGRVRHRYKSELSIEYGLERYYIPETARKQVNELAQRMWSDTKHPPQVIAEVAVWGDERTVIRRILVDGKPLTFTR